MANAWICPISAALAIVFAPISAWSAGTVVSGYVVVDITVTMKNSYSGLLISGCGVALSTNDKNANLATVQEAGKISGTSMTCKISVYYNWLVQSTSSNIDVSVSAYLFGSESIETGSSTSETIASFAIPTNGTKTTLAAALQL